MKRFSILLAVAAALVSDFVQAQTCTATLCGVVTNAETGAPVPFAEVVIAQLNLGSVTDEAGKFHFHNLCDSTYTVVCQHVGCEHVAKEVKIRGNVEVNFELHHEALDLQEVVIRETAVTATPAQAERQLSGLQLDALKGQTLGDALSRLPGVTTLNTGSAIVKPVIRGLHSNRILMFNNGVRLEGQQWGSEHAPEIDPYIAGKVSVVYGANSVRYGPDAIGGVILVEPNALREQFGMGGEVNLAGFSNGRSGVASAQLDGKLSGKLPLAGRLQGTFRRGGNLRTPDYFLENTGIQEFNYAATLGLERERWQSEVYFSQFFTKIGIFRGSHIGNLTDLQNAIERGRPLTDGDFTWELGRPLQRVAHYLLKVKNTVKTGDKGKLTLQYARQFNRREEFDAHKRFGEVPDNFDNPEMMFEITTHTLDAAWEHKPWRRLSGSVGGQFITQRNTTDRGGLIPDFNSQSAGFFWIERWRKYPFPLELEAGVRYDLRRLDIEQRGNEVIDKQLNFNNLSGTFGAIYHLAEKLELRFHAGSAWRSPSVSELFSDGVHHGSASYEVGRDDLQPERAFSLDLTIGYDNRRNFSASLSLYRNMVKDFIFLKPLPDPVLTIRGAFPSFAYEQTDARLTGLEWSAEWSPLKMLAFSSSASILRAWNQRDDDWLVLMPADRFRHGVTWFPQFSKKTISREDAPFVKLSMVNVLRQSRTPENQDYAPPPAAYTLFDAEAGTTFTLREAQTTWYPPASALHHSAIRLRVGLAVQNVFNTAYRDYLNRLRYFSYEAGRNVSVRLKLIF